MIITLQTNNKEFLYETDSIIKATIFHICYENHTQSINLIKDISNLTEQVYLKASFEIDLFKLADFMYENYDKLKYLSRLEIIDQYLLVIDN